MRARRRVRARVSYLRIICTIISRKFIWKIPLELFAQFAGENYLEISLRAGVKFLFRKFSGENLFGNSLGNYLQIFGKKFIYILSLQTIRETYLGPSL